MAKRPSVAKTLEDISGALPHLIRLPNGKAWIDYDEEADVLYVSLKRPQKATDTEFLEDKGIILRYKRERVGRSDCSGCIETEKNGKILKRSPKEKPVDILLISTVRTRS